MVIASEQASWRTLNVSSVMQFPIDLEQYDRREQLKKSGLGKVRNLVMLQQPQLFVCQLELESNFD